ncbi:MAG TPA: copper chaperone PCu(A)C [Xanthobacteraceae bacterium]|nr:copper chaperone PCu(A)C [Xanthobacteraceae bacterium]
MRFVAIIGAIFFALASTSFAHDFTVGSIHIEHPWSRVVPKGANVAAGYLTIENRGAVPDRLVGGSSVIAGRFEIHQMTMVDGVMKMRPLEGGLEIAPGKSVTLEPGGYHLMFFDLKEPPVQGKFFKGTLVFEKAGKIDVEFDVEGMGPTGGDHMNMDMKH